MIVSMGMVVAITPDDKLYDVDPYTYDWTNFFVVSRVRLNGPIIVRVLDGKYDVPQILGIHSDPISFHPETKFISLTAAVLNEDAEHPRYTGSTEVTAIIETGAPFVRPREVVDAQDRNAGLKVNKGLLP